MLYKHNMNQLKHEIFHKKNSRKNLNPELNNLNKILLGKMQENINIKKKSLKVKTQNETRPELGTEIEKIQFRGNFTVQTS